MNNAVLPGIFYSNLDPQRQRVIDQWHVTRNVKINDHVQRLLSKSLQSEVGIQRKCTSFVRFHVRALVQRDNLKANVNEAILTIWNPSEDQLSILKEGNIVQFRSLGVSPNLINGILQLSANKSTSMERLNNPKYQSPLDALDLVGYEKQTCLSLIFLTLKSKQLSNNTLTYPEINCKGYLLDVRDTEVETSTRYFIYLTDASGLLLRIEYETDIESTHFIRDLKKKSSEEISERLLNFSNVRLLPYDYLHGQAVGIWTESTFYDESKSKNETTDSKEITVTPPTKENYMFLLHQLNLGMPCNLKVPETLSLAYGYIVDFGMLKQPFNRVPHINEESNLFYIEFDCFGDGSTIKITTPHHLVLSLLQQSLNDFDSKYIADFEKKTLFLRDKIITSSVLIRILIQEFRSDDGTVKSFMLKESSRANVSSLAHVYLKKT